MFNSKIVPSGWWMGLRRIEKGRRPQWDVVLHRPQTLVPSSGSTTSVGPDGPSAAGTWCFTARKPLFLRPEAPRLPGPDGPPAAGTWCFTARKPLFLRPEAPRLSGRMGRRRRRRGTSPPANPCSFVRKHHVYRAGWAAGGWNVVLHCPQTLVPSSGGTTSVGPDGPPAAEAWCFTARKPLFLRPEAPRLSALGPPAAMGRGTSPPANPYSFVRRHHV